MASGTQGYQTTSGSLLNKAISEARKELNKKKRKRGDDGKPDPVSEVAVAVLEPQAVLMEAVADSWFRPGSTGFVDLDLEDDDVVDVLYTVVREVETTNALLGHQTALLRGSIDLEHEALNEQKRLRRESRLEKIEDLSGVEEIKKEKKKKGNCECNDGLLGGLKNILMNPLTWKIGLGATTGFFLTKAIADLFKNTRRAPQPRNMINITELIEIPEPTVLPGQYSTPLALKGTNIFNTKYLPESTSIPFKESIRLGQQLELVEELLPNQFTLPNNTAKFFSESVDGGNLLTDSAESLIENGDDLFSKVDDIDLKLGGSNNKGVTPNTRILQSSDEIGSTVVDMIDDGKGSFNMKKPGLLRNFKFNPKTFLQSPLKAIALGYAIDTIYDQSDKAFASLIANRIANLKSEEEQAAAILKILFETYKEQTWMEANPELFKAQQVLEFVKGLAGDRGLTNAEEVIKQNNHIIEMLIKEGYGDLINIESRKLPNHGSTGEPVHGKEGDFFTGDDNNSFSHQTAWGVDNFMGSEIAQVASVGDLKGLGIFSSDNNVKINPQSFFQSMSVFQKDNSTVLSKLTDDDWKWLAYAISGEARLGTDDIYGVMGVILNRFARGDGTIEEIIKAPGQFEAYEEGMMYHDDALLELIKNDDSQKKLLKALEILDGRTEFKGQGQIHNRVPSEDPMFHELGNFYHYNWQSPGGGVAPSGWTSDDTNFLDTSSIFDTISKPEITTQGVLGKGVNQQQPIIVTVANQAAPQTIVQQETGKTYEPGPTLYDEHVASVKYLTMLSLT